MSINYQSNKTRNIKTIIVPQFSNNLQVWFVPVQELCKNSLGVLVYGCNLIFSTCLSNYTFKLYAVSYYLFKSIIISCKYHIDNCGLSPWHDRYTCTNSLLETKQCQNKLSFLSINQNVIPNEEETCFVTGMISVNQKFVDDGNCNQHG